MVSPVTFTEKLKKVSTGKNKASASRSAGLSPTAISNYIASGVVPRADIAMKIARAVGVSFEWLVDDSQDFPPPMLRDDDLSLASDHDLMLEICRRFRLSALRLYDELNRAQEIDWIAVADVLLKHPPGSKLPDAIARNARLSYTLHGLRHDLSRFDPSIESIALHNQLPGRDVDPEELMEQRLQERCMQMHEKIRGFAQAEDLYGLHYIGPNEPDRTRRISETTKRVTEELAALKQKTAGNKPTIDAKSLRSRRSIKH